MIYMGFSARNGVGSALVFENGDLSAAAAEGRGGGAAGAAGGKIIFHKPLSQIEFFLPLGKGAS